MEIKDKLDLDQNGTPVDATKYRSMIGALMYLTSSRPDIVHATCLCARYQAKPTEKHLKEVKRIFRYLRGTVNTARAREIYPGTLPLDRVEILGSVDDVTTSLHLSQNSRPPMLDHQDKYMMKAQGRLLASFQDREHEGGVTRSQDGIKDNDIKIKIQDHSMHRISQRNSQDQGSKFQERLSRFTSNPSRQHWKAITRVFKYLRGTKDYGLSYVGYPLVLEGYSNASWDTQDIYGVMEDTQGRQTEIFQRVEALMDDTQGRQTKIFQRVEALVDDSQYHYETGRLGHLATALGKIRALQAREQACAGAPEGASSST
nr:retrovirus-related Pol polyprotein from transposon TNT 1-94 [Tanacetum cinerariifolium]